MMQLVWSSASRPVFQWTTLAQWLLLGALFVLVLGPVLMILLGGFDVAGPLEAFRFGLDNWVLAWSDPQVGPALWNTFTLVTLRAVLGFMVAIPIAWLIARTNTPASHWLEFGFWIAFFMPSLAYIQGWVFLLEADRGLINQWLMALPFISSSPFDVHSYTGIIWVHMMSQNVSAAVILLVLSFRNMDSSFEEAARISGASRWRTLSDITLPLSRPVLAVLVVVSLMRGMESYEIEAVLGQPAGIHVYSTLVVWMINGEPPRIPEGSALSTLVLITLIPLIVAQRLYVGHRQYATIGSKMRSAPIGLGTWRWVALAAVSSVILLQTLVPFLSVVAGSLMIRWGYFAIPQPWTLDRWRTVLNDEQFLAALANTLTLGVVAGLTAAVVCFAVAYVLVRTRFSGRTAMDFVSWLPWAIPGVLLSLGLLTLVLSIAPLRMLYGSMVMLVIAVVLFRFPLNVHLLKSGIMQVSKELEEASTVCGAGRIYTQIRILVPILMPMIVAVALMTFVTAVNEISGIVLLASTETRTLSLLSLDYQLSSAPQREAAAVVTTVMILLCAGMAFTARALGVRLGAGTMMTR